MNKMILLAILALAGCVDPSDRVIDGRAAFAQDCAGCHGVDARGGGEAAAGLPIAPPDLTRLSANNGGVFPRDYVMSTIDGLSRRPHFSQAMPEFGAGDMGPIVNVDGTPVPARLLALAGYLEGVQR